MTKVPPEFVTPEVVHFSRSSCAGSTTVALWLDCYTGQTRFHHERLALTNFAPWLSVVGGGVLRGGDRSSAASRARLANRWCGRCLWRSAFLSRLRRSRQCSSRPCDTTPAPESRRADGSRQRDRSDDAPGSFRNPESPRRSRGCSSARKPLGSAGREDENRRDGNQRDETSRGPLPDTLGQGPAA